MTLMGDWFLPREQAPFVVVLRPYQFRGPSRASYPNVATGTCSSALGKKEVPWSQIAAARHTALDRNSNDFMATDVMISSKLSENWKETRGCRKMMVGIEDHVCRPPFPATMNSYRKGHTNAKCRPVLTDILFLGTEFSKEK